MSNKKRSVVTDNTFNNLLIEKSILAPLCPWIETDLDPFNQIVKCRINGEILQDSNTSLMIFNIAFIISYLSAGMTLLPGTVIMTGTPAGCGFARKPPIWLKPGDTVEVEIGGIGVLSNPVVR